MTRWERLRDRTLSVAAIRQVDRTAVEQFHIHSLVLMENASSACARWLAERSTPRATSLPESMPATGSGNFAEVPTAARRAVILCGRGNNGGDGLAIARHLRSFDWQCEVILLGPIEQLSSDARANWQILTARSSCGCTVVTDAASQDEETARLIESADVIIDAMLGTGASGSPRAPLDRWIELANRAAAERIAIDIPTGLDAETGSVAPRTFRADVTLSFVARKPGFRDPTAQSFLGEVNVMPIGIPVELIDELLAQSVSTAPGGGS